jgi:hypothetical protein
MLVVMIPVVLPRLRGLVQVRRRLVVLVHVMDSGVVVVVMAEVAARIRAAARSTGRDGPEARAEEMVLVMVLGTELVVMVVQMRRLAVRADDGRASGSRHAAGRRRERSRADGPRLVRRRRRRHASVLPGPTSVLERLLLLRDAHSSLAA